mmetsp:Transcript_10429/g.9355  ORF Transcript_10429/g.9355 Transcript_10429/m.9355 type:complete len:333 (+) Transcript_10429:1-999(+)
MKLDMKWIALLALVIQNSGLAIMMRFTIVAANENERYMASSAVLNAELMKLIISIVCCYLFDAGRSLESFNSLIKVELSNSSDWFKLMIPSILYTLQNSLQYFSMTMLSAPVFQVLYQMKIITTALFSVLILSKRIGIFQWLAIVALAGGVALVQLSQLKDSKSKENSFSGLISVLLSCLTSGFAGVYFEMVLKSSKASIWIRNIQLAAIGIVFSIIACYYRDKEDIIEKGFLFGYDHLVWSVIILQAAGGMIVAVVVKYADNVLKGFATSISIILSCLVSSFLLNDVNFNLAFCTGAIVVLAAVFAYSYSPPTFSILGFNASQLGTKVLST